jgi:hypothetical protein
MKKKIHLYVRRLDTRKIVKTLDVTGYSENQVDRIVMGLLRNMNRDEYFVDDSEASKMLPNIKAVKG